MRKLMSRPCFLLMGLLGGLAAPQEYAAAQTAAPAPPPSWQQGRPDTEAAAKIAPVAAPPLPAAADKLPLAQLKLAPGFKIEVYASGVGNARSLRIDDKGIVYVSSRTLGRVYAIVEKRVLGKDR